MQFEPLGGFPPIILDNKKIKKNVLESRNFQLTNIVSINNIMNSKRKEDLFVAFGSEEEDGFDNFFSDYFNKKPHEYSNIDYQKI